jgi:hypothetical protein
MVGRYAHLEKNGLNMIRVEIETYRSRDKLALISDEDFSFLRAIFHQMETHFPEKKEDFSTLYSDLKTVISKEELDLFPESLFHLVLFKPIKNNRIILDHNRGLNQLQLREAVNATVQVHFANNRLMDVREVDWMEDACTEELQKRLKKGWKILAVLPQVGNRRPDYVLGLLPDAYSEND